MNETLYFLEFVRELNDNKFKDLFSECKSLEEAYNVYMNYIREEYKNRCSYNK